jgi:hypothetical protein
MKKMLFGRIGRSSVPSEISSVAFSGLGQIMGPSVVRGGVELITSAA